MMWGASEGMGWWMLFGSIFWVAIIALVVFVVVRAFGSDGRASARPAGESGTAPDSALEIARRRYAAGELSEDDFRRMMENLNR